MDQRYGPPTPAAPSDSEAAMEAFRLHIRNLTENGTSPEALMRALVEQCGPRASAAAPNIVATTAVAPPTPAPEQDAASGAGATFPSRHQQRLSISTANTTSTSRSSVLSMATSLSSTSSHGSNHTKVSASLPGTQQFSSRPTTRAYWCTSCGQKLQRKFDWKRHEEEFHERYKKYPCPDCNRVFYGANTFNQHHKSRHGCSTCPHSDKVVRYTKRKRAWGCGFCAALLPTLDRYFEHVAMHYESGKTKAHWDHGMVIYGLLHQNGLYNLWKSSWEAKYAGVPRDQQPKMGWDPRNTGRVHGFIENENPGQLQDLLEFFDPAKDNAASVIALAWQHAILVQHDAGGVRQSIDGGAPLAGVRRMSSDAMDHDHVPTPVEQPRQVLGQQQQQQQLGSMPLPPQMAHASSLPHLDTAMVPLTQQPMPLDRPLPAPGFDQTYFSPASNPSVEFPASPLSPLPALDFSPFGQPMGGFSAQGFVMDDWNSLAGTMVDDMTPGATGAQPQHPHQHQHHQQQMMRQTHILPSQQQQQAQQQHFWPSGHFSSHT